MASSVMDSSVNAIVEVDFMAVRVGQLDFQGAADVDGFVGIVLVDFEQARSLDQLGDHLSRPDRESEHLFTSHCVGALLLLVQQDRAAFFEHGDRRAVCCDVGNVVEGELAREGQGAGEFGVASGHRGHRSLNGVPRLFNQQHRRDCFFLTVTYAAIKAAMRRVATIAVTRNHHCL